MQNKMTLEKWDELKRAYAQADIFLLNAAMVSAILADNERAEKIEKAAMDCHCACTQEEGQPCVCGIVMLRAALEGK